MYAYPTVQFLRLKEQCISIEAIQVLLNIT